MKKLAFSLWLLAAGWLALAGVVALKNGKVFVTPGDYEVKGQYLVFENEAGQLIQLPVKMVDLEKSKRLTEERAAQEEAKRLALKKPPPKANKDATMAEIAEFVEKNRPKDAPPPPENVNIDNENLGKYGADNPRLENSAAPFQPVQQESNVSAAAYRSNYKQYHEQYKAMKAEVEQLNQRVADYEERVEAAAAESAFSDEPTGANFRLMERYEKELEQLKKARDAKVKEMDALRKRARRNNVKDLDRGARQTNNRGDDDDNDG